MLAKLLGALLGLLLVTSAAPAFCQNSSQSPPLPGEPPELPGEYAPEVYSDPFAPFNQAMFTFNLKLDHYVVRPVAKGYADVLPTPARQSVGRFFDNISFIPRFANNLFQLRALFAMEEVARFGINTTIGVGGLFDPAANWFGIQEHPDDFGLTLGHYGVPSGPYLVLPFLGPKTIRAAVGYAADGSMWPLPYLVPWYIYIPAGAAKTGIEAVNYRSLHLNLFEEVDRYAIDLYGAVQSGYLQTRASDLRQINETSPRFF
ncbi:MAG: MlaA family lipoprotein [Candidatus Binataceae bacterium]